MCQPVVNVVNVVFGFLLKNFISLLSFFVIQDSSLSVKLWTPDDDMRLNATVIETGITTIDPVSVCRFVNKR